MCKTGVGSRASSFFLIIYWSDKYFRRSPGTGWLLSSSSPSQNDVPPGNDAAADRARVATVKAQRPRRRQSFDIVLFHIAPSSGMCARVPPNRQARTFSLGTHRGPRVWPRRVCARYNQNRPSSRRYATHRRPYDVIIIIHAYCLFARECVVYVWCNAVCESVKILRPERAVVSCFLGREAVRAQITVIASIIWAGTPPVVYAYHSIHHYNFV